MSSPQSSDIDYGSWINRSETIDDVASMSTMQGLEALLELPTAEGNTLSHLGHWLHFTPTAGMSELGEDGHPKLGGFLPPFPYPRRMWVGSRITFHAPICIGQSMNKTTTIDSITPKQGKNGGLIFLGLRHEVSAEDTLALTEHQTIVYREAAPVKEGELRGPTPPRQSQRPEGDWDWCVEVQPNEIALFRFSALTFNSHRIHYDLPYATGVEGYPGLVVHGPLSATLIMAHFQDQRRPGNIDSFEFTARSPLFADERAFICGRQTDVTDGKVTDEVSVTGPDNIIAIEAKIQYQR